MNFSPLDGRPLPSRSSRTSSTTLPLYLGTAMLKGPGLPASNGGGRKSSSSGSPAVPLLVSDGGTKGATVMTRAPLQPPQTISPEKVTWSPFLISAWASAEDGWSISVRSSPSCAVHDVGTGSCTGSASSGLATGCTPSGPPAIVGGGGGAPPPPPPGLFEVLATVGWRRTSIRARARVAKRIGFSVDAQTVSAPVTTSNQTQLFETIIP